VAILNAGVPEVGRCECLWTRQADDHPRCKPKLKLEAEAIEGVVEDLVKQKLDAEETQSGATDRPEPGGSMEISFVTTRRVIRNTAARSTR